MIQISVEREEPHSVSEILETRRRMNKMSLASPKETSAASNSISRRESVNLGLTTVSVASAAPMSAPRSMPETPNETYADLAESASTYLAAWTNRANDILASARDYSASLEDKGAERDALATESNLLAPVRGVTIPELRSPHRRRRRDTGNFSINSIPE